MKKPEPLNPDDYRALQYFRQAKICQLYKNSNPVVPCLRYMQSDKDAVELVLNGAGRAFYRNLQTCNRVWLCPICANKISKKRRSKLQKIVQKLRDGGAALAFITYTIEHNERDSFKAVRDTIQGAYREFHSHRQWQLIEEKFAWIGSIRALEVTLTENGWHIHLHEIGFIQGDYDRTELSSVMSARWARMVAKSGGAQLDGIGLKVKRSDEQVRRYITKWGIVPELTGFSSKGAYGGGAAPFQLPDIVFRAPDKEGWAADKFSEYAEGIRGARQLMPGRQLKSMIGEESAGVEKQDRFYSAVASLTPDQWRLISTTGRRVQCLRAIEDGLLEKWLDKSGIA